MSLLDAFVRDYEAWEAERSRITDIAENNIITAIKSSDLSMSKWWLQVMREEFVPRQRVDQHTEHGGTVVVVNWDDATTPSQD